MVIVAVPVSLEAKGKSERGFAGGVRVVRVTLRAGRKKSNVLLVAVTLAVTLVTPNCRVSLRHHMIPVIHVTSVAVIVFTVSAIALPG